MAMLDDSVLTTVGTNWTLLLSGVGMITNMEIESTKNLEFRYDTSIPVGNVASRKLYSITNFTNDVSSTKMNKFENDHYDSKIYGRATNVSCNILITREV